MCLFSNCFTAIISFSLYPHLCYHLNSFTKGYVLISRVNILAKCPFLLLPLHLCQLSAQPYLYPYVVIVIVQSNTVIVPICLWKNFLFILTSSRLKRVNTPMTCKLYVSLCLISLLPINPGLATRQIHQP